ncbi:hypothetical protein KUTeg_020632 [Tegillarca granosa]|uniref:Uncharacterized protein n=1 Tax=Tegillarca granosa TaxID=220873 RepID=A0ABQ9EDR7_TEGGR|nr:hypothetical protein KUTeg_020632 [Tegillarca granosa]
MKQPSVPQYLWASPTDHFGLEGETFKLKCIFSGNPTPEVYWQYPDGTQNKPDKVSVSLGGQEITVPNLSQQDAGSYECYGKNTEGSRATRTFRIRVESKPTWVKEPHDIETSIGATATYLCEAKGTPTPQILWYINGVPLEDSENPTINSNKFMKPNKNNITFVNLDKSDTMVIQCNASNKHGYVFADVYLNVLEEAPQFLEAPYDKKTSEGQSVNMTCRTSGKPDPTITWYRDGDQITGGRYKTLPNGNLHIEKVVLSDSGNYTCTAENRCGKNCGKIAGSGILIVRRRTRIEFKPSDLEIGAGKDGKFTCSGTTDFAEVEHLHIYWRKDGKTITSNDQRMTQNFQDNSLTISGTIARDSGVYTCVVTNGLDQATASAILTVKDRPDPPLDVVAESCSQTQAVISWTKGAPNNAPIQYFTIQYNTSFAPDLWVFAKKESSTQNKAYVPLTPWTQYTFRVLATNKIGTSEPSYHTLKICETQPRRPSKNPENVRDIGDNPQALIIDWTPMPEIEHNGPNFNYIITVSNPGEAAIPPITITDWRVSRHKLLVGGSAEYFRPYNVTVKARNNVGESSSQLNTYQLHSGEWKPTIVVSTFAVDAAKLDDTSAVFIWDWNWDDANNRLKMRGRFKGFKIQFWRKGAREQTFREIEIPENQLTLLYSRRKKRAVDTLQATITGLSAYTNMEAQIVVINTYYAGPPSLIVGFRTSEGGPRTS